MMPSPKHSSRNLQYITFAGGSLFGFVLSSLLFLSHFHFESTIGASCSGLDALITTASKNHHLKRQRRTTIPSTSNDGWKQINVFYGDQKHIADVTTLPKPYFEVNQWFSQYRQDEIVARLLNSKKQGFFVDLASNDAIRISNTYALETQLDWKGICLEPNPVYWGGLAYRKCEVVAAVVGNQTLEEVHFTFPKAKAPKGGIVGGQFDNKNDDNKFNTIQRRYTVTLKEIFQTFQAPRVIDYLSLDVEGAEDLVLSSFPFTEYRFNVLTVERPSEPLSQLLNENGYSLLKTLKAGKETLWIHDSIREEIDVSALKIDSQNYKYRESMPLERIAPEEMKKE
ncbi:unnamed protein product [Cylindrotheca closterium]|uniref:Methyltransferase FkbM domain-containing protein n=1 Tax=Cylindrotheca closterium TaxID=2856 RepID=A0AAD2CQ20_9STRA|nr:unnamed protein product [Cylindrotheca closterium]